MAAAPERTRWDEPGLASGVGETIEDRAAKHTRALAAPMVMTEDGPLISSLCRNGLHAPCLDVDLIHRLRPRPGHLTLERLPRGCSRLILRDVVTNEDDWRAVHSLMVDLGWCAADSSPTDGEGNCTVTFTVPVRVVSSSNPANRHIYIETHLTWGQYRELLEMLQGAGVVMGNWVPWALERGQTMLLRPGLTKAKLSSQVELFSSTGGGRP